MDAYELTPRQVKVGKVDLSDHIDNEIEGLPWVDLLINWIKELMMFEEELPKGMRLITPDIESGEAFTRVESFDVRSLLIFAQTRPRSRFGLDSLTIAK